MDRSAYRDGTGDNAALYCGPCFKLRHRAPEDRGIVLVMDDERRIVKRHALLGKRCVACGIHFLEDGTEARDTSGEAAFRAQWARDIEAGKALPSAGDLFDKGESDGR